MLLGALLALTAGVSAPPFHPQPYAVGCVERAFADAGVKVTSAYAGSGAKFGWVFLLPDPTGSVQLQVVVAASPNRAALEKANANAVKRLHPTMAEGHSVIERGNLVVSYRDRPRERELVTTGLRHVAQVCG